ncbi:MAG: MBL fold metallo-hydrolase [Bacilli bacterium]|nr:MBL fold metallo-hydrolase [Bacilli bacterium]
MKITILVDNNTYIDRYYLGEPAASFYIEIEDKFILFDTGYSDVLLYNAQKMGLDLSQLTHIVISHGHNDHTNGLKVLNQYFDISNMRLIAHPECFLPKYYDDGEYVGAPYSIDEITDIIQYIPSRRPYHITDNLVFLGEIERTNHFENQKPIGKYIENNISKDDYLLDDSALVYKCKKGIFIITGCSHSGICNIVEYAKKVCKDDRVLGIVGGFHLFEDNQQLKETIQYLEASQIQYFYPCHCVSLLAKAKMMEKLPVKETGVGMVIEIDNNHISIKYR